MVWWLKNVLCMQHIESKNFFQIPPKNVWNDNKFIRATIQRGGVRVWKLWDSFRRRSNHLRMHETLDSTCENWTYHMAAGDDASYFYSFIRNFISVARIMHLITIDSSSMMTSLTHCNYIHCDPILVIFVSFSSASVIKQILKFFFNF